MSDPEDMYCSDHSVSKSCSGPIEATSQEHQSPGHEVDQLDAEWEEWEAPEKITEETGNDPDGFVTMSTATLKAQQKRDAANKKRREREKRKRDEAKADKVTSTQPQRTTRSSSARSKIEEAEPDSDDAASTNSKTVKKRKADATEQKVTAYIHVQSISSRPPAASRSKGKAEPPPVSIQGPCFFNLDQTYEEFRAIIAKGLPCKLKLLPSDHVSWKYEKPANDAKKPLSSLSGYEAMLMSLSERKSNHVIQVYMPPPKADDVTWDTGDGDFVRRPYDHDLIESPAIPLPDLSAKAQIARIAGDADGHLARLQEQYPIGNCSIYPHYRVLERTIGGKVLHWELNLLRLQIWSHALSTKKDGVTIHNPPNSIHFDVSGCLKPKAAAKPEDISSLDVLAVNVAPAPAASIAPNPLLPQPVAYPSMAQLPNYPLQYNIPPPWMYGHQSFPIAGYPPLAPYPFPQMPNYPTAPPYSQPLPASAHRDSPASSPGTVSQLRIPLADFCSRYEISKTDEEKLALLEYKPGNNAVLMLATEDWKEVKFSTLGWKAFIAAHKQLLRDVKDGTW